MTQTSSQPVSKPTVTVGITAYNEAANIADLLFALLRQVEERFRLAEIIVVSDGSTDATERIMRTFAQADPRIRLVADGRRLGQCARMNQVMEHAQSDIVILLDADVTLEHAWVLAELVLPLLEDETVMHTSGYALPLAPRGVMQRIAHAGAMVWEDARRAHRASPIYFSEGRIRAFRRAMYSRLRFQDNAADGTHTFLYGERHGLPLAVCERALVRYRLPATLIDYLIQMRRFRRSASIQRHEFSGEASTRFYTVDSKTKLRALILRFFRDPVWTALYVAVMPVVWASAWLDPRSETGVWKTLDSTKTLRI